MNSPIMPIVVFFLVVGIAVGWLLRAVFARPAGTSVSSDWQRRLNEAETARARLQSELNAARSAESDLRSSLAAADDLAEKRAARVAELEEQLEAAERRVVEARAEVERLGAERKATETAGTARDESEGTPPARLPAPEGAADDLKMISGIGPGIEKRLHGLGVYHFRQIAAFTPENVAWIGRHLRFPGRIERENWIAQAKTLAAGGETEFSRRHAERKG